MLATDTALTRFLYRAGPVGSGPSASPCVPPHHEAAGTDTLTEAQNRAIPAPISSLDGSAQELSEAVSPFSSPALTAAAGLPSESLQGVITHVEQAAILAVHNPLTSQSSGPPHIKAQGFPPPQTAEFAQEGLIQESHRTRLAPLCKKARSLTDPNLLLDMPPKSQRSLPSSKKHPATPLFNGQTPQKRTEGHFLHPHRGRLGMVPGTIPLIPLVRGQRWTQHAPEVTANGRVIYAACLLKKILNP